MTLSSRNLLAVGAAAALIAPSALALSYDAATDGTASQAGYTFTTKDNAALGLKTVAGFTGLGVQGGYSGNEIDVGQWLQINFTDGPQTLDYLTIAFLYDGPEFGDPDERAKILADGIPFFLQATGEDTVTWTGTGSPDNISPANGQGGGVWRIDNPFSGPVTTIRLKPVDLVSGNGQDSDFSLLGFGTGANLVPDGGTTLVLLGLALAGLPLIRRKNQS